MLTAFYSENAILIESPEIGQIGRKWAKKRAKIGRFTNFLQFSQKPRGEFFFNRTKWSLIMIPISSENAILIESPEVGQIGQKVGKNRQFYKLCLISLKLCDEFFSNCIKWRFIMTPFSSAKAILIESLEVGQIGQKWPKKRAKTDNFTNFA